MQGQPPAGQWMQRPQGIPGCPPGLEYLCQIDQLLVKQQVELLEGRLELLFIEQRTAWEQEVPLFRGCDSPDAE